MIIIFVIIKVQWYYNLRVSYLLEITLIDILNAIKNKAFAVLSN